MLILAALGMGLALAIVESISEGTPRQNVILIVLGVFIGIEGVGVLLGYVLSNNFWGFFDLEGCNFFEVKIWRAALDNYFSQSNELSLAKTADLLV